MKTCTTLPGEEKLRVPLFKRKHKPIQILFLASKIGTRRHALLTRAHEICIEE